MTIQLDLSGRVALVTGGARGVGRGITDRLLAAGATVVVCGRHEPKAGSLPDGVSFLSADVRQPDAVGKLVDDIVAAHGTLDVAVNNAGGSPTVATADASPRFSEAVVRLNLLSALHVATRANAQMQTQANGGVIVNISSLSGMRATPMTAAYGAAKAGLLNLTQTLAMEWAPKVRVVAVSAGIVRTEGFEDYYGGPDGVAAVNATVPMGRVAEPADVGNAVVFVASPLGGFISGSNLVVDGGGERLAFTQHLGGAD